MTANEIKGALGATFRPLGGDIVDRDGDVLGVASVLIGRSASDDDLLAVVAATAGDRVQVMVVPGRRIVEVVLNSPPVWPGVTAMRWLEGDDGRPEIYNAFIEIKPGRAGLGLAMFASQVVHSERLGIHRIRTSAARGNDNVGYSVWHKMGYLAADDRQPVIEALGRGGLAARVALDAIGEPGGRSVHPGLGEVLDSEAGRAWWETYGVTYDATFDCSPGSSCMRVLHAYIIEKLQEQSP